VSRVAPRPLSGILPQVTAALSPASTLARVQEVWPQAAGPTIASRARPFAERDGVLTIACDAAVWAQELDLMGEALIEHINGALGSQQIHRLRCRTR
jgi:predicted nucleic acid-binding Zn ribbon protein